MSEQKFPVKMFVYGTLREGFGLHNSAMSGAKFLGKHRTVPSFSLYAKYYPWLTRNGNTSVTGEVYEVDENRFKRINSIECGAGYKLEEIELEDGQIVSAYIYPREEDLKHVSVEKIEGGDFVAWKHSR